VKIAAENQKIQKKNWTLVNWISVNWTPVNVEHWIEEKKMESRLTMKKMQ